MTRHLFLTGPIGCGKSTAIAAALGERAALCGGFFTKRYREPHLHFALESPDRQKKYVFLDFASGKPELNLNCFRPELLQGEFLVLDEIGGIELLNPEFCDALETVLKSDVPILGVIKGAGPAGSLIEALNLTAQYEDTAQRLRRLLQHDPHTTVYECKHYDEYARELAVQWAEEYLHD